MLLSRSPWPQPAAQGPASTRGQPAGGEEGRPGRSHRRQHSETLKGPGTARLPQQSYRIPNEGVTMSPSSTGQRPGLPPIEVMPHGERQSKPVHKEVIWGPQVRGPVWTQGPERPWSQPDSSREPCQALSAALPEVTLPIGGGASAQAQSVCSPMARVMDTTPRGLRGSSKAQPWDRPLSFQPGTPEDQGPDPSWVPGTQAVGPRSHLSGRPQHPTATSNPAKGNGLCFPPCTGL